MPRSGSLPEPERQPEGQEPAQASRRAGGSQRQLCVALRRAWGLAGPELVVGEPVVLSVGAERPTELEIVVPFHILGT